MSIIKIETKSSRPRVKIKNSRKEVLYIYNQYNRIYKFETLFEFLSKEQYDIALI